MRLRRSIAPLFMVLALLGGTVAVQTATAEPASAGTGLFYQVVDADADPYSGIYLRNSNTNFADATRVTSRYVLYGTTIELVCGAWGVSVGYNGDPNQPNYNRRWHLIYVPSGYAAGQTGWMPDRYLNTPNIANQLTPGEPECGAAPPPPPPPPSRLGAVYFSPYPLGQFMPDSWASVVARDNWSTGTACSNSKMVNVPTWNANAGLPVTTLAGWSLGRVGPLYYLQRFPDRRTTINYIVMIDPGSYDQLRYGCDWTINANTILYDWLRTNANAKLVIFSGAKTEDRAHPSYVNGQAYYHRGIQEVYFQRIRGDAGVRSRVLVCNYQGGVQNPTNEMHQQMFWNFDQLIDRAPITSCPNGGYGWRP